MLGNLILMKGKPGTTTPTFSALRGHPDQLVRGKLLETDLLHVFVTVVLCGGLTPAAQVLHRTQAAVSLQIKRLEDIAQAQLLHRSSRGVELTPQGRLLLSYAQKMLALNEEAMLGLHSDAVAGPVRIGTYHHFAADILPPILRDFAETYPDVWVEVHVGLAISMSDQVMSEFDIVVGLDEHAPLDSTVLSEEQVSWYTSVEHAPHLRDPLPIAVLPEGSLFRRWAIDSLSRDGRRWRIAQVCSSAAVIESAVAAGLAIAVFKSGSVTSPQVRALTDAERFPALPPVCVNIRTAPGKLSAATDKLRDFIVANVQRGSFARSSAP